MFSLLSFFTLLLNEVRLGRAFCHEHCHHSSYCRFTLVGCLAMSIWLSHRKMIMSALILCSATSICADTKFVPKRQTRSKLTFTYTCQHTVSAAYRYSFNITQLSTKITTICSLNIDEKSDTNNYCHGSEFLHIIYVIYAYVATCTTKLPCGQYKAFYLINYAPCYKICTDSI